MGGRVVVVVDMTVGGGWVVGFVMVVGGRMEGFEDRSSTRNDEQSRRFLPRKSFGIY